MKNWRAATVRDRRVEGSSIKKPQSLSGHRAESDTASLKKTQFTCPRFAQQQRSSVRLITLDEQYPPFLNEYLPKTTRWGNPSLPVLVVC